MPPRRLLRALALASMASAGFGQTVADPRLRVEPWAGGLVSPMTFAFVAPGEMLVLQKDDGTVLWFEDGVLQGVALDLDVMNAGSGGVVGIATDPDFASNGHVYLLYSSTSTSGDSSDPTYWLDHRLERFDWNGTQLVNGSGPLFAIPNDPAQAAALGHTIGPIRFGAEGAIYGQVGDHGRGGIGSGGERVEMNTATAGSALAGAIFRVASDGTIPADNPFVGEADASFHPWWSYGLRNGFGLAVDRLSGELWDTENGPEKFDEVNLVPRGMNSGWILIMGPDAREARYADNQFTSYDAADLVDLSGASYVDPRLSFKTPIGITAIVFLHSKLFPADLRDQCVFGDTNTGDLFLAAMKASRDGFDLPPGLKDKVVDDSSERSLLVWGSGWNIPTDLQIGPDGYLYVLSYVLGEVRRIRPVTDTVYPAVMHFPPGVQFYGIPENVELSDDRWYEASQEGRVQNKQPPYKMLARFVLNEAAPTSIVLELEGHYQRLGFGQDIYVKNATTGKWEKVDSAVLGSTDELRSITLSPPTDYVDPITLFVDVRVDVDPDVPVGSFRRVFKLPPRPVHHWMDLFQLSVTYP
jgi:glucose/arabinose dehydrogenase